MGGSHDCDQALDESEHLEVTFPEPVPRYRCGNGYRSRITQQIVIDGSQLAHLTRFFERVQDDDDEDELHVVVRAGGTLTFHGSVAMYSADVGYAVDH